MTDREHIESLEKRVASLEEQIRCFFLGARKLSDVEEGSKEEREVEAFMDSFISHD